MKSNVLVFVIVLLLAANFCHGQNGKETVAKAENQNKAKTEKKVENKSPSPQPFQPSEEVSADAVISFPTDI